MDITVGHMKNFFLGQHRQSYPTLNLKYQNPCMTTIYLDISESLGRREGKSSQEVLAGYQRWVKYAVKIAAIQLSLCQHKPGHRTQSQMGHMKESQRNQEP